MKSNRSKFNANKVIVGAVVAGLMSGVAFGTSLAQGMGFEDANDYLMKEMLGAKETSAWKNYEVAEIGEGFEEFKEGEISLNEFEKVVDRLKSEETFLEWMRQSKDANKKEQIQEYDNNIKHRKLSESFAVGSAITMGASVVAGAIGYIMKKSANRKLGTIVIENIDEEMEQ